MNRRYVTSFILLIALVASVALIGGCAGTGNNAIGILNVEKVMTDSAKVKQLQDQLNNRGKELSDQLEKDKPNISAEEYQKRQETAYGEFLRTKQDLESQIDNAIKQALEQVAKEKNLGVVLYKNGVAQGGIDITDDVLKKMQ